MRISHSTYQSILDAVPSCPPETGGMLGGRDGIVSTMVPDEGVDNGGGCCRYSPDVAMLNECLAQWANEGIEFYGMFHSHFFGVSTLSEGDKSYIVTILKAMPPEKTKLYFPLVVLPERKIVPYLCYLEGGNLITQRDEIDLVEDE